MSELFRLNVGVLLVVGLSNNDHSADRGWPPQDVVAADAPLSASREDYRRLTSRLHS